MEFLLKLKNIEVRREGKVLIHNINWEMKPGENWAILGRNGAGKSTLLQVITGYKSPFYGGSIYYFGKEERFFNVWDIREKIGYISYEFEGEYRYNEMGIDVALSGFYSSIGLYEVPDEKKKDEAMEWFLKFKIEHLAKKKIKEMSQGERQKVFLIRALVHKPLVLILDEPFVGLDIPSKEGLLEIVDEIGNTKTSLILTTHSPEEIMPSITHILYLKAGTIFSFGKKEDMLKDELFSKVFDCTVKLVKKDGRYRVGEVNLNK